MISGVFRVREKHYLSLAGGLRKMLSDGEKRITL